MTDALIQIVNELGSLIEALEGFLLGFVNGYNTFILMLLIVGIISLIGYFVKETMRLYADGV